MFQLVIIIAYLPKKNYRSFGDKFFVYMNLDDKYMIQTFSTKTIFSPNSHCYGQKYAFIIFNFEYLKYN